MLALSKNNPEIIAYLPLRSVVLPVMIPLALWLLCHERARAFLIKDMF
jgi:hypothetical protein